MSTKNPTIKRILKEASELAAQPSADFTAAPLETDLFEWHFTLRGPPAPSPFAGGLYHGRIVLPPAYPLKPPSFRFLTPSGRFEVNREICLSISGHHEETWQPAWGVRTALVAIRSFMDTESGGQLGGMEAGEGVRRMFAERSSVWKCAGCGGRSNGEIMKEHEEGLSDGEPGKEEVVPEELRLAYREDLGEKGDREVKAKSAAPSLPPTTAPIVSSETRPASGPAPVPPATVALAAATQQQQQRAPPQATQGEGVPSWIDKAIYGILAALAFLFWKKYLL